MCVVKREETRESERGEGVATKRTGVDPRHGTYHVMSEGAGGIRIIIMMTRAMSRFDKGGNYKKNGQSKRRRRKKR